MVPAPEKSLVEDSLLDSLLEYSHLSDGNSVSITALFSFPETLDFFSGHFPAHPVFPAFLQIVLVRLLVEKNMNIALRTIAIGKTKFSSIIRPDEEVRVLVNLQETAQDINTKFKIYCSGDLASTGTIIYGTGK
jgi:3-hydroxyacyl-[acyl-carrier-protein] dehydratase